MNFEGPKPYNITYWFDTTTKLEGWWDQEYINTPDAGATIQSAAGYSAGTSSVIGVGASTVSVVMASAGVSTAIGVGASIVSVVITSAGVSTAIGVGASISAAVINAAGINTAIGVGSAVSSGTIESGAGYSAGTSIAILDSASIISSEFSATGINTSIGVGGVIASAAGYSAGVSDSEFVGEENVTVPLDGFRRKYKTIQEQDDEDLMAFAAMLIPIIQGQDNAQYYR